MADKVNVIILTGFGINSDYESQYAFELAGAENVKRVHMNDLIDGKEKLDDYEILMFPGGFSFGDDLGSGRVLANKFRYNLREDLLKFINDGKLIFGVCNGFQILVKMGILPAFDNTYFTQSVSLIGNKSGKFESHWIKMKSLESKCVWTQGIEHDLELPVRHGEGQFVVKNQDILDRLHREKLIPLVYSPNEYPNNPNGAIDGIAGICDESGRVFGMMPHPEIHLNKYQHPKWTRGVVPKVNGLIIFQNAVNYAKKNL